MEVWFVICVILIAVDALYMYGDIDRSIDKVKREPSNPTAWLVIVASILVGTWMVFSIIICFKALVGGATAFRYYVSIVSAVTAFNAPNRKEHIFDFFRNVIFSSMNANGPGWHRFWDLLGQLIPRKTRCESWNPGKEDLLVDFLEARKYRTKWAKRWLNLCFVVKTFILFIDCWRVIILTSALSWIFAKTIGWIFKN